MILNFISNLTRRSFYTSFNDDANNSAMKIRKVSNNYPCIASIFNSRGIKITSDKYDCIGNTIVLNGRMEQLMHLSHAFQRAKRSNYKTRRSCSGNLARSSRTTFGWSIVSFISCCLKDCVVGSRGQG